MKQTFALFRKFTRLQEKYNLITSTCPKPSIITPTTRCECQFPDDKQINYEKPLLNTKAIHWKHVLVHSRVHANDWHSKVEHMPTELISIMSQYKRSLIDPMHPVLISNIDLSFPSNIELDKNENTVLVYPDNTYYKLTESTVKPFMSEVLNPNGTSSGNFQPIKNENPTILICGHTKRDIRCGMIAPLLKEEFETNLEQRGLLYNPESNPQGIKVGLVSHIGGHAYAGNVLYFDEDGFSIWYGRVKNDLVDGIIQETIVNKNIIKDLYRGRY